VRTVHRIAAEMRADAESFLERKLGSDASADPRKEALTFGALGKWFFVIIVVPSYPSHPDDGVAWKVYIKSSENNDLKEVTGEQAAIFLDASLTNMLGDLEEKVAWLRGRGTDLQDMVDDILVREVMES